MGLVRINCVISASPWWRDCILLVTSVSWLLNCGWRESNVCLRVWIIVECSDTLKKISGE